MVPRALAYENYYSRKLTASQELLHDANQSIHFVQGTLTRVVDNSHVEIRVAEQEDSKDASRDELLRESTQRIPFDYLVLATGCGYASPVKSSELLVRGDRERFLESQVEAIQRAKGVLVIGGGAVGVEVVSELAYKYGTSKKLAILTSGDRLLPSFGEKPSRLATRWLMNHHVQIITNQRAD